jgi:hypothetical protein
LAPNHYEAKGKLGEIYLASGKTEEAEQIADNLVTRRPQYPQGYILKSGIALRAGKVDEGIAQLDTSQREPPPITGKRGCRPATGTTTTRNGSPASLPTFPTGEPSSSITTGPTRMPTAGSRAGARVSLMSRRKMNRSTPRDPKVPGLRSAGNRGPSSSDASTRSTR